MEREILENAFAQALDELNDIKKSISEQNQLIKKLTEKMEGFDEKPEQQKVRVPSVNMQPFGAMMTKFTAQLQATVMSQPKSIVRQFRILLFPEQNAGKYYRLVFGRLLFWMMIFLLATYLFVLSKHFIDNWAIIKEKQLEKTQYKNAWNYLYQHQNKQGKKKMEEAWEKGSIAKH